MESYLGELGDVPLASSDFDTWTKNVMTKLKPYHPTADLEIPDEDRLREIIAHLETVRDGLGTVPHRNIHNPLTGLLMNTAEINLLIGTIRGLLGKSAASIYLTAQGIGYSINRQIYESTSTGGAFDSHYAFSVVKHHIHANLILHSTLLPLALYSETSPTDFGPNSIETYFRGRQGNEKFLELFKSFLPKRIPTRIETIPKFDRKYALYGVKSTGEMLLNAVRKLSGEPEPGESLTETVQAIDYSAELMSKLFAHLVFTLPRDDSLYEYLTEAVLNNFSIIFMCKASMDLTDTDYLTDRLRIQQYRVSAFGVSGPIQPLLLPCEKDMREFTAEVLADSTMAPLSRTGMAEATNAGVSGGRVALKKIVNFTTNMEKCLEEASKRGVEFIQIVTQCLYAARNALEKEGAGGTGDNPFDSIEPFTVAEIDNKEKLRQLYFQFIDVLNPYEKQRMMNLFESHIQAGELAAQKVIEGNVRGAYGGRTAEYLPGKFGNGGGYVSSPGATAGNTEPHTERSPEFGFFNQLSRGVSTFGAQLAEALPESVVPKGHPYGVTQPLSPGGKEELHRQEAFRERRLNNQARQLNELNTTRRAIQGMTPEEQLQAGSILETVRERNKAGRGANVPPQPPNKDSKRLRQGSNNSKSGGGSRLGGSMSKVRKTKKSKKSKRRTRRI